MNSVRLRPSLAGVSPATRWRSRPSRGRRGWTIGISLLLHALAIAALLSIPRREQGETSTAPSYQLMFEGGQGAPAPPTPADKAPPPAPDSSEAPPASPPPPPRPETDAIPGPESPAPEAPPDPQAPVQPPPAPPEAKPETPPEAPPKPAEVVPAPLPPPPVLVPPAPAPPAEAPEIQAPPAEVAPPEPAPAPPSPQPPEVRLDEPRLPAPAPPTTPELASPTPPAPPAPPPRPRPRTAPPPAPPGTFGNPMDLSFNSARPRSAAPRLTAPRGSVASRSLDLSPGVPKGPDRSDMFFDARAARIGGDWREALKTYWINHRYYPRQAAENGEDGSVDVELTVGGNGRVQSVVLKSRSGSQFIDMAAVGTWRNAQLPPLPPELANPYTFTITINYVLIR